MIAYPANWDSGLDVPEYCTPGYDRVTKTLEFRLGPLNLELVQLAGESVTPAVDPARWGMPWAGSAISGGDWGYGATMLARARFADGLALFGCRTPEPGGRPTWLRALAETLAVVALAVRPEPTRSAVPQMLAWSLAPGSVRQPTLLSIRPAPFLLRVLGARGAELAAAAAEAMAEYAGELGARPDFGGRLDGRDVLVPTFTGTDLLTPTDCVGPGYVLETSAQLQPGQALCILAGFGRICDLARL